MTFIHKILVANRGEIASRIMRTCRAMGISTVAVFSDADDGAPHVDLADEAVRIGPPPASESYLDIDRIVAAARATGADAVHPGYGFLAENAEFAARCQSARLVFIGPDPEVIRKLGSKRESKRIAAAAGVPVIPGYAGEAQDDATLVAQARAIGFPVLIKPSAGGGGKGMRVVRSADELDAALPSARREAQNAFGDAELLVEKYIDRPRHIEFQILGDHHGTVIHLLERECSIQRRHQKIVEETPSVAVDDDLRRRMGAAAVALGQAVGYRNAGTVEFIVDPEGAFYFLEVNTRLQVEHPITECVTGVDLVREQIRIARGQPLELGDVVASGAAIECRLYAEDPRRGFLPTTGRLCDWHVPQLPGLRVDTGVRVGTEIGIHYDPMLAKVICHAPTRDEAIDKMLYALRRLVVAGVVDNRELLVALLEHPAFRRGEVDTHFVDTHAAELRPPPPRGDVLDDAAIAAALCGHERRRARRSVLPSLEPGFRNNPADDQVVEFRAGEAAVRCRYRNLGANRFSVGVQAETTDDGDAPNMATIRLIRWRDPQLVFEDARGIRKQFRVVVDGDAYHVHSPRGASELRQLPRFPEAQERIAEGGLVAPMPGTVVDVLVTRGQAVRAGDALVILEAMKMEHAVTSPRDGVVTEVRVAPGDRIDARALLAVVGASDS